MAGTEWEDVAKTMFNTLSLDNPDKTRGKVDEKYKLSSIATTVVNETEDSPFLAEARINTANVSINMLQEEDFHDDNPDPCMIHAIRQPYRRPPGRPFQKEMNKNTPYNKPRRDFPPKQGIHQSGSGYRKDAGKPFNRNSKEVCEACGKFGHNHMKCSLVAMVLHILEWVKTHQTAVQPILKKHRAMNSINGRRAVVRHLMDMNSVDNVYEDDLLESGVYDAEIESMVNTLTHFDHE